MKKYLVPDASNPEKLAIIGASGFVPENVICELLTQFENEEAEWLVVTQEEGEFGEIINVVSVNQTVKDQILAERQANQIAGQIRSSVQQAIMFGNKLIEDFAVENVTLGITQDGQTGIVLDKMQRVSEALRSGSLYEAINRIKAIPAQDFDTKYITEPRMIDYLNRIELYLQLPLTTEL